MTVGSKTISPDTYYGYSNTIGDIFGSLDDTSISYDRSYTVQQISNTEITGGGRHFVVLDAFVPRGSVFDIGGMELTASASAERTPVGEYRWENATYPGWIDGQKVTVSANLAPVVTAAAVNGATLTLTFAEDLDTNSTPAAGAFTLYIAGDTTGVNPSSVDSISGKTVTMTLATAVTNGQTVTLDYAKPATNPLRDESELDAPGFTGRTVTNNTPSGTCDAVWCATLTAQSVDSGGQLGCSNNVSGSECSDASNLSEDEFNHAMTDYAVTAVRLQTGGQLHFWLDTALAADTQALALEVGGELFYLEDADDKGNRYRRWDDSGLTWSSGAEVELKLRADANTPATGAPEITGTAGESKTLTAAKGTISDDDGTSKADNGDAGYEYTYQWVRVDASDNESGISGATSKTYTLAAADVDHTIKVEATFKDDAGKIETRTSAAYPSSGSVLPAISFDSTSITVVENVTGGAVVFTVNRTGSTVQSTVDYATRDGVAIAGEDYTAVSNTLTFLSGETSKTVSVPIVDDDVHEGLPERFYLDLSNVSGAVIEGAAFKPAVIENDEADPQYAIDPVTVNEGDGTMTVTLTATVARDEAAIFRTNSASIEGTAIRGDDYADFLSGSTFATITLAAGEKSATFDIAVIDDNLDESDETVVINWSSSNPNLVLIFTGTIVDNDNTPATGAPGIDGVPQVGQTLTATAGNMADDDNLPTTTFPTGYAFQWVRVDSSSNESNVPGATARTYVPAAADVGNTLKVEVTFTDGGGTPETLASAATAAVVARQENCATDRPNNDWCATMTVGSTTIGSTTIYGYDTGNNGTYGALDDTTIDYGGGYTAVELANVDIPGGGSRFYVYFNSFVPRGTAYDIGGAELVTSESTRTSNIGQDNWDVATRPGWVEGQKVTVSANLAPIVTAATVDGDQLTLTFAEDLDTGSEPAGSAFTVTVAGSAVTVDDVDISGDAVTLDLASAATRGQTVTVDYAVPTSDPLQDESGIDAPPFTGRSVTNNTGNNVAEGTPAITGPAQVGMTLTADTSGIDDDDGVPANVNYQWVRITEGDVESNIGANASTYTLTAAEQGHNIRVDVSFTDNEGNAEGPLPSGETWLVMPAAVSSCDASDPWCATLTAGHEELSMQDIDDGENSGCGIPCVPELRQRQSGHVQSPRGSIHDHGADRRGDPGHLFRHFAEPARRRGRSDAAYPALLRRTGPGARRRLVWKYHQCLEFHRRDRYAAQRAAVRRAAVAQSPRI